MKNTLILGAAMGVTLTAMPAFAGQNDHAHHAHQNHAYHDHTGHEHKAYAPITIMGDHAHKKGEWMVSYRFMRMHMEGNRNGKTSLSPLDISGDFANVTGVGPTSLRIVPLEMDMDMHMLGAMYGVTDRVTLALMGNYLDKDMSLVTYAMMNPDQELGRFSTRSKGLGDTKVSALVNAYEDNQHSLVAKLGVSLPTGSIKERDTIMNPMGVLQDVRLPYSMQLGSGTYDLEPGFTYTGHTERINWGAQYQAVIRLGENSQDYTFGDKHVLSGWSRYSWNESFANSLRLSAEHESKIDGRDTQIVGPVQTANPNNYGGRRLELGIGADWTGTKGALKGHHFAAEVSVPLWQNLNGPQMERDYNVSIGYKIAF